MFYAMSKGAGVPRADVLQGTLDLMILKTLQALGPLHGFGIARRIETVYTSLLRLQQNGWISSRWGTSENKRRAKFYSIITHGRKQLTRETNDWQRIAGVIRLAAHRWSHRACVVPR